MTYKQELTKRLEALEEKLKILDEAQKYYKANDKERRVINGEIVDPADKFICEGCS